MLLVVDNGSVFTKNLSDFLLAEDADFDLLAFDRIGPGSLDGYDSFILSGRRGNDRQMNALNSKIVRHCVSGTKKLLGICYGAELLALTLGGTIRRMPSPQMGNEKISITRQNPLSTSPSIDAYESHRYELSRLGDHLLSVGASRRCRHEIIGHKNNRIFGTQFHPEMTPDGRSLIANFLDL